MRLIQRTLTGLAFLLIIGMPGTVTMVFAAQEAAAAGDQRIYEVRTRDGTRYYGYLQVDEPDRVVIRTPGGATIELPRADIISMAEAEGSLAGREFRRSDPNPTRLFFGPTGRSLKKGEGYVGVYELFLPFVQVGVTDRLSIGGGTPLIFGDGGNRPFWFTPKLQVYEDRSIAASIGVLHFLNVDDVSMGIAYAAGTFGTRDNALTIGLGWAYASDSNNNEAEVVAMVGGEQRVSRRLKLITENYIWNGGGLVSGGIRFLGESLSADLGLFVPLDVGELVALPMVNFLWKF